MTQTISCLYGSQDKAAAAAAELKKHRAFQDAVHVAPSPGDDAAGGTLVTVHAPFGSSVHAMGIMRKHEPIDRAFGKPGPAPYAPMWSDPAPLSHFFRLPVLTAGRARLGALTRADWSLSNLVGLPLLSTGAATLSGLLHLPTLMRAAAPLSSMFHLKLLSSNPSPLSNLIGWPTLIDDPAPVQHGA